MTRGPQTSLWIAVGVLAAACLGTGVWAAWTGASEATLKNQVTESTQRIASLEASLAAASQLASATSPPTPAQLAQTTTPSPSKTTTSSTTNPPADYYTGSYYGYVRSFKHASNYTAGVDFAQFLTGTAAAKAATAHGDESPPPNDYYILNESTKVRTYPVGSGATLIVLGWNGGNATDRTTVSRSDFLTARSSGSQYVDALYKVTLSKGVVTKIEQVFLP